MWQPVTDHMHQAWPTFKSSVQNLKEKCAKVHIKSICCAKYHYNRDLLPLRMLTVQIKMPYCATKCPRALGWPALSHALTQLHFKTLTLCCIKCISNTDRKLLLKSGKLGKLKY